MTSNIDLTITNADVMSMELDSIIFSELDAGETLGVDMTVYDGDNSTVIDTWFNTYYADSRGNITLADLARVWNNYILYRRRVSGEESESPSLTMGGIKVKITLTEEDDTTTTIYRRVWYSTKHDGMTVANLNARLPFVARHKRTFPDAMEMVYVAGPTQETVTVTASYVQGTHVGATSYSPAVFESGDFGYCFIVSPAAVSLQIPNGARLVSYEVKVGILTCTYDIEDGNYAQRTQFHYMNRWGAYESLWCVGSDKWTISRNAEHGYCGNELLSLDIDVSDTYEVSTGYVDTAVLEQLRDLAESPSVWIYDGRWWKVAVKEVKMERERPSNRARSATITYNYAKRNM